MREGAATRSGGLGGLRGGGAAEEEEGGWSDLSDAGVGERPGGADAEEEMGHEIRCVTLLSSVLIQRLRSVYFGSQVWWAWALWSGQFD